MKLMVIGFPKSGTTTITHALRSAGLKAAHWVDDRGRSVGELIYRAAYDGLDPLAHLAEYDAITQADFCSPAHGSNYWPNLDFALLRAIRRAHPSCLFLLNYRKPEAIADSIASWAGLQARLQQADIPGLPRGYGGQTKHLITWIENHFDACRRYFANDDYFLEIEIEAPDAPIRLGEKLGVSLPEWGNVKPEEPVYGIKARWVPDAS